MSQTFRGDVVLTPFSSGIFWERLIVDGDTVILKPWLREGTAILRSEIQVVEVVKVRIPFIWKTLIRFRRVDGTLVRRMFVAMRTQRVRQALQSLDWPIRDVSFLGER